ncbi:MAG: hypothetical protein ACYTGC_11115 [Planctomycetota bacterium]|jgi:hypothetical protein
MRLIPVLLICGCGLASLSACRRPAEDVASTPPTPEAVVPATLFASTAPADAIPLISLKSAAKAGDRVVFEARVGGRRDAFLEDRAVFFVADSSLLSCDQLHGDTCKTPWDYCCEPRDNLTRHMATVQVVDGSGNPLKRSLAGQQGLEPLKTVIVTGTVDTAESGAFVVNAETIHVKEVGSDSAS